MKSAYIHIPFCTSICSYCDFCKFFYNQELVDKYIDALIKEISSNYKNEVLDTIYIGGGTPSSLDINNLEKLLSFIKNNIKTSNLLEYTIECNVMDINIDKLELFKKYNINRISVGIESFNSNNLSFLERNYNKSDIISKINLVKKYFDNINIDLIYAIPNEDIDVLKNDIDSFISLDIPHISCYSLIIEDHTKLGIKKTECISEDLDYDMYKLIESKLEEKGYKHYEISNYAKDGYESKHNLCYWMNHKYYGFGLGSSGYIDNIRYTNTRNINKYLDGNYILDSEIITKELDASNYAILGLRTSYGVNKKEFFDNIGVSFNEYYDISDLIKDNLIIEDNDSFYLNKDKWYIENEILIRFI